jgi:5S rRNA maturation endonuclease (ribonuclease M5)
MDKELRRKIWEDSVEFFHTNLMRSKAMVDYQTRTRKHDLTTLRIFKVGYFDDGDSLLKHLSGRGHAFRDITRCGLFSEVSEPLAPEGSYTYPIYVDRELRNIRFTNSRGGGYISKECAGDDYPLWLNGDAIQEFQAVYLVEEENDLLSMHEAGHKNTIAVLGGVNSRHIKYLQALNTEKTLILALDNDELGRANVLKTRKALENKHQIRFARYQGRNADECLKKGSGDISVIVPETYIRNYFVETAPNGKTHYEYQKSITHEMRKPIKELYCFENSEGKRLLYSEQKNREIDSPEQLWVALFDCGYVLDFSLGGLSERKYLEYVREHSKTYNRISNLYEVEGDKQTRYLQAEIGPEKSNVFRQFMSVFTVESEKDEYRLAAGLLSAFLNREFDGDKPLFALIANNPSSGKTSAARWGVRVIQGQYPVDFDGVKEDEEALGSHLMIANKFALYDNIEFPTSKQFTTMERVLTNKHIKSWIMHVSHGYVPNNKTYFATFNNDQALRRDLLERALIIRMKDGRDVPYGKKIRVSSGLETCFEGRDHILADIYAHLKEVEWEKEFPYRSHPKFTKWSREMAKILHVFYPEVTEFDFSLTEEDRDIDMDLSVLKEMLSDMTERDDDVFLPNNEMLIEFKNFFGERHPYAGNTIAMSRKLSGMSKSLDRFVLEKTKRKFEGRETRGWVIRRKNGTQGTQTGCTGNTRSAAVHESGRNEVMNGNAISKKSVENYRRKLEEILGFWGHFGDR